MMNARPFTRRLTALTGMIGALLGLWLPLVLHFGAYSTSALADQLTKEDKQMADEEKQGADAAAEVIKQTKLCTDPVIVKRVQDVGARIAAVADREQVRAGFGNDKVYNFKYVYKVIDSKEVNAFSLPGGHIFIYTGLLNLLHTDDELAGVLGHETAHAAHHHVVTLEHEENKLDTQMLSGVLIALISGVPPNAIADIATGAQFATQAIMNNHFSEAAEEDADHTGMIFMQHAGYNPVAMMTMLQRLEDDEQRSPQIDLGYLQDHPLTPARIDAAKAELNMLGVPISTEAERLAAGAIRAKAVDAAGTNLPAVRLTVGRNPIALLAPSNRDEANAAADRLNTLLDNDLRNDQVRAVGASVIAGGKNLITYTPADVNVQPVPSTPEELALASAKAIQKTLFEMDIKGFTAQ